MREIAAAGNIDYVYAKWFKAARQFDRLLQVPAAFLPIGGGDAKEQRQAGWPYFAHSLCDARARHILFSSEPPNSSIRILENGERNSCNK